MRITTLGMVSVLLMAALSTASADDDAEAEAIVAPSCMELLETIEGFDAELVCEKATHRECTATLVNGVKEIIEENDDGSESARLPLLCAHVYGSLTRVDDSNCGGDPPDAAPICGDNDNGGGGGSQMFNGDASVDDKASSVAAVDCEWDSPVATGQYWSSCSSPHDPHTHWHSEAQMAAPHKVGSFARDYPLTDGPFRAATAEMTYNEAGKIAGGT